MARTLGTLSALALIGAAMTGVAARSMHGGMRHRVGGKACRRIDVAITALDPGDWDMGRCR